MWNFLVETKNVKNLNKKLDKKNCLVLAIVASILLGVSAFIIGYPALPVGIAVGIALLTFVAIFFKAFVLAGALKLLTDRKGFENALMPVAYIAYVFSVGLIVAGLLNLIPAFGAFLSWLVLVYIGVLGYSLFFRQLMDNYRTDVMTMLLGLFISLMSIFAATGLLIFSRIDLIFGGLF